MPHFAIHPRLAHDCFSLGTLFGIPLLLMNNSKVPWFILVPKTTETELYALAPPLKEALANAVDALSRVTKETFNVDKLNVAAIGNMVPQLHIHVVGRFEGDFCWPHPVWGAPGGAPYTEEGVAQRIIALKKSLPQEFLPEKSAPQHTL